MASVAQTGRETGEIVGIDLAKPGVGEQASKASGQRAETARTHSLTPTRHGFPQDLLEELVGH